MNDYISEQVYIILSFFIVAFMTKAWGEILNKKWLKNIGTFCFTVGVMMLFIVAIFNIKI